MLKKMQKKKLKHSYKMLEMLLLAHYLVQKKIVIQTLILIQTLINQVNLVNRLEAIVVRNQTIAKLVQALKTLARKKMWINPALQQQILI